MTTDNEIIKALKCCHGEYSPDCENCLNEKTCKEIDVVNSVIDLINRQKAEIEMLQKRLDIAENCIYDIEYASDKAGSNDRIDEAIDNYNNLAKEMTEETSDNK